MTSRKFGQFLTPTPHPPPLTLHPSFMLLCPRPYAQLSQNALSPSPSLHDVIYEWPLYGLT